MATFRAENAGFRFALAQEGFEPVGETGRVVHPVLRGKTARRAYTKAWLLATFTAREEGLGYWRPAVGSKHPERWFPFAAWPWPCVQAYTYF